MKKFLLLASIFLLVGCSSITINKENFITKIDSKMGNMLTISDQELTSYDIDLTKFKDYVFKISFDKPNEIYILVLPESKKETRKEIEKFLNKKNIKKYYDNNFGDYLFYIVSNKDKEIYKEMNDFVKNV